MKKIVIEQTLFDVGEIIDLKKHKATYGGKDRKRKKIEDAKRAIIYEVKHCTSNKTDYYLFSILTDTKAHLQLNNNEIGECDVVGRVDLKDLFGKTKEE